MHFAEVDGMDGMGDDVGDTAAKRGDVKKDTARVCARSAWEKRVRGETNSEEGICAVAATPRRHLGWDPRD